MSPDDFDKLTNTIADFLMDAVNVEDPGLSATLTTGEVRIAVDVMAETFDKAVELGDSALRFAVHSAGVSTPFWETQSGIVEMEEQDYIAVFRKGGRTLVERDEDDLIDA